MLHLHHTPQGESFENIELSPIRDASGEILYYIEKMEPLPQARGLAHIQGLIGRSPAFLAMMELVTRVAPSEAAVLFQGESGTGKELVANAIHQLSKRAEGPFVAVDCSGLAETLFESELFGHERGAFTGATARKTGLVEAAAGGTLFLDEVGDIPLSIQVKLLRLLETGTFRRVGSPELRKAEVRIVSATHRPLSEMVADGRFRQDLFYRLNIFPIHLPPLRQRGGCGTHCRIPDQTDCQWPGTKFLSQGAGLSFALRLSRKCARLAQHAGACRIALRWRRDQQPASTARVDHGVSCGAGELASGVATGQCNSVVEQPSLARLASQFKGNRKVLAEHLGWSERTLYRRLKALGANRGQKNGGE